MSEIQQSVVITQGWKVIYWQKYINQSAILSYFMSKYFVNCNLQRWMRGKEIMSNYFLIISDKLVKNIY